MEVGMQVQELPLSDPGQDGPAWTWTGVPGLSPELAEHERRKFAGRMLHLQRQFCLSGDPIHALTAMTWCQLYRAVLPPWVERTVAQMAWAMIMAPTIVRGRRIRRVHWIRFAAVSEQLRRQREAGMKKLNKRLAFREASVALRGQLGRGAWSRVQDSYRKVVQAIKRGEIDRFAVGALDNRYPSDPLGNKRARFPLQ
jgi:hypothetical protein